MAKRIQICLNPEEAADNTFLLKICARLAHIDPDEISTVRIIRRSVDARKKNIKINLTAELLSHQESSAQLIHPFNAKNVSSQREVIIIGAGPAGLFAALRLIELGIRPVIVERGKEVSHRKRDIARISREHIVNPDSNYCFGEGGAGTFSDGKLYTRSKKRGDNIRVLELLCLHGANESILYEAHPHLGTDKLPGIISGIRRTITDSGGEIIFNARADDFLIGQSRLKGLVMSGNYNLFSPAVILATGHSARDIYYICKKHRIDLELKSFAMGVRVEHRQELIDKIQYHGISHGDYLPPASYSLVKQVAGRGVYSFCMCPGGFIVPSATSQEEVVVNGMSPSKRNSPYANSGIVVEINAEDLREFGAYEELAGLEFQKELEKTAWENGGRTQVAPAQRLTDFILGRESGTLPKASYSPGIISSSLDSWLPVSISQRLKDGFRMFDRMMKGFITDEAIVLGVESRTSSPVRIPRNPETLEHIMISGLFPCGEGSGYSGGIVSSAVDGIRAAEAVVRRLGNHN